MSELRTSGAEIDWPDGQAGGDVRAALTGLPLGGLAPLATWWATVAAPGALDGPRRPRLLVVGAEPSTQAVDAAAELGVGVRAHTPAPDSSGPGAVGDGETLADDETEAGTDLLVVAVPLRSDVDGSDVAARVIVSVISGTEPARVVRRGAAATDPQAWMARTAAVRDRRREVAALRDEPDALLAAVATPSLACAAGALLRAAVRRTPVLLDGPGALAVALLAYEAQPRAVRWWALADAGDDPLARIAAERLGQRPALGLGCGTGDGLAGVLTVPVLRAAARLSAAARGTSDG